MGHFRRISLNRSNGEYLLLIHAQNKLLIRISFQSSYDRNIPELEKLSRIKQKRDIKSLNVSVAISYSLCQLLQLPQLHQLHL
jgi:hypothetical protein